MDQRGCAFFDEFMAARQLVAEAAEEVWAWLGNIDDPRDTQSRKADALARLRARGLRKRDLADYPYGAFDCTNAGMAVDAIRWAMDIPFRGASAIPTMAYAPNFAWRSVGACDGIGRPGPESQSVIDRQEKEFCELFEIKGIVRPWD